MSVRRTILLSLLALSAGGATAVLAACGSSRDNLLPPNQAQALLARLEQVQRDLSEGRCDEVANAAESLASDVRQLPSSVDLRLRRRLRQGADALVARAPQDCTATTETTTTETVPTTTTETTPTVTEPPATTTTQTIPQDTTTIPPETTPSTTTPDGTGGAAPETVPQEDQG